MQFVHLHQFDLIVKCHFRHTKLCSFANKTGRFASIGVNYSIWADTKTHDFIDFVLEFASYKNKKSPYTFKG